jgi:DNA-binding transcriptional MocR family regulator
MARKSQTYGGAARLASGNPGERLLPVTELAEHYEVARNTIMKALRRLADDGLVEIVPNWGPSGVRRGVGLREDGVPCLNLPYPG